MAEQLRYGRGHMCAGCEYEGVLHGPCIQVEAQLAVQRRELRMAAVTEAESVPVKNVVVEKPSEN